MMEIEEARKIANQKFITFMQPYLDDPESMPEPEIFIVEAEKVKAEIEQETGRTVHRFFVHPLGFGLYEIATVFTTGETLRTTHPIYLN